jgi:hypothetical protein
LWRGPALADVADADVAEAEIVRLAELRLVAHRGAAARCLEGLAGCVAGRVHRLPGCRGAPAVDRLRGGARRPGRRRRRPSRGDRLCLPGRHARRCMPEHSSGPRSATPVRGAATRRPGPASTAPCAERVWQEVPIRELRYRLRLAPVP